MKANSTWFENLSDRKEIPVTIAVHLDPCIKDEFLKSINNEYYEKNLIQINGFDPQNPNEIDLSNNEELLNDLVDRTLFGYISPISDFILKWEASKGLKITKNKHLQDITGILILFCYRTINRSEKLYELLQAYMKFKSENILRNKNEDYANASKKKKKKLILSLIIFIIFLIFFLICFLNIAKDVGFGQFPFGPSHPLPFYHLEGGKPKIIQES